MYHMMIINNLFLSVLKVMQPIKHVKYYCRTRMRSVWSQTHIQTLSSLLQAGLALSHPKQRKNKEAQLVIFFIANMWQVQEKTGEPGKDLWNARTYYGSMS